MNPASCRKRDKLSAPHPDRSSARWRRRSAGTRLRPLRRQRVDRGRRLPRIDRPAHHGQRPGPCRMLVGVHDRGRGIGRNGRLAHRQHMRPLAGQLINYICREFNEIIDVIVEVETAFADWHELGVAPVGDKHVMLAASARPSRAARSHSGPTWARRSAAARRPRRRACEMLELPERLPQRDVLVDLGHFLPTCTSSMPNSGLPRGAEVGEYFKARCNQRAHREIAERIARVAEPSGAEASPFARWSAASAAPHRRRRASNCPGKMGTLAECGTGFIQRQVKLLRRTLALRQLRQSRHTASHAPWPLPPTARRANHFPTSTWCGDLRPLSRPHHLRRHRAAGRGRGNVGRALRLQADHRPRLLGRRSSPAGSSICCSWC